MANTEEIENIDNDENIQDDGKLAIEYAEENNLGPNQSIVSIFSQDMKTKLKQMIRQGKDFNPLESALLKALMSEALSLDELGVMLGATSERTKGKPMSKVAALKELNRILDVIAKRTKLRYGISINVQKFAKSQQEMRRIAREQHQKRMAAKKEWRSKQRELRARAAAAEKEFYQLLHELRAEQSANNLPHSQYRIRYKRPDNVDISKVRKYGGEAGNDD